MKKMINLKALVVILVTLFVASIISAQNSNTIPVQSKPTNPSVNNQLSDPIQKSIAAVAHTIRTDIFNTLKMPLILSKDHPLKVNLSNAKDGPMIVGLYDGIIVMGHAKITNSVSKTVNDSSGSDSLHISGKPTVSQDNIEFVGNPPALGQELKFHIEKGEYSCKGNFSIKDIPMYFESGTMIFTDNVKPCTFSEGCSFFYNSVNYVYSDAKWVKN